MATRAFSGHVARRTLTGAIAALLLVPAGALAGSAPDRGRAFDPAPKSQPLYAVKAPDADPARQRHVVTGMDGTDLYVETWLPAPKGGHEPPARVPTILIMTPYVQQGEERYTERNQAPVVEWFVSRGYAVAQHHVRGTGQSGGCIEQTSTLQIDDGARVVEYLGRDAPWSNGSVGMYGISYDAETQISVAGRGDPNRTRYLKAIVPAETVGGQYEYSNFDGVPYAGQAALSNAAYLATTSLNPGVAPIDAHTFERFGCQPELVAGSIDYSGDLTPFWQIREYRPQAGNIKAATLWLHGLSDWNVDPLTVAGFYDRLPAGTPHKGIFGFWEHNYPDKHAGVSPDWERADWLPLATAWYDRWLKDLDTGVEAWPAVQVQGSDGQWRAEPDWPRSGGPVGQLALGPDGTLGVASPTGSTSYVEGLDEEDTIPGTRAVFTTPALAAPLHLTGQPVLDVWLTTTTGDGHVVARLQVLAPDGSVATLDGSNAQEIATYGMRSLRHLEPMPNGYFVQQHGQLAPIGTPIRVPLRFQPNDLVVPAGGRLRLTVAGMLNGPDQTTPSGTAAQITLLHDCGHPSALRFLEARPRRPARQRARGRRAGAHPDVGRRCRGQRGRGRPRECAGLRQGAGTPDAVRPGDGLLVAERVCERRAAGAPGEARAAVRARQRHHEQAGVRADRGGTGRPRQRGAAPARRALPVLDEARSPGLVAPLLQVRLSAGEGLAQLEALAAARPAAARALRRAREDGDAHDDTSGPRSLTSYLRRLRLGWRFGGFWSETIVAAGDQSVAAPALSALRRRARTCQRVPPSPARKTIPSSRVPALTVCHAASPRCSWTSNACPDAGAAAAHVAAT